ncbi:MAG: RNHCP domain-containing protein [Chloroflexota bacterium]|nr:RNHCP domain-containing protein [Chloroflexota bacterium]
MAPRNWDDADDWDDGDGRGHHGSAGYQPKHKLHPPRNEADQAFKCGHCKQFIGAPIAGGRQRNHCPNCLYSRHVDDTMPGDRKSTCGSIMKPVGLMSRRNGELVLIHECLGCGKQDPNRIAADDNPVLLETIPIVAGIGLDDPVTEGDDFSALIPEELRYP